MSPILFQLSAREETHDANNFSTPPGISRKGLYIIGFSVAAALALGVVLWFAIRSFRRRVQMKKGNEEKGPLVLVRGAEEIVRQPDDARKSSLDVVTIKGPPLSHTYTASTVVLPQRAMINPEGITKYKKASGTFSRPFGPISDNTYSLKMSLSPDPSPSQRSSYASTTDGNAAVLSAFPPPPVKRFSGLLALSGRALLSPQLDSLPVRQIFPPVLPDELRLTRLGERLTVVKSFDDGWCIVSRAKHRSHYHSNSVSSYIIRSGTNGGVEMGAVPTWCFAKPIDGRRPERFIRRSSLGMLMDMGAGICPGDRDEGVMKWPAF